MTRYIINLSGALKEGREGTAMQSGYWSTPLTVHQELIHPRKSRRAECLYKKNIIYNELSKTNFQNKLAAV